MKTIDYYEDVVECENCGEKNTVTVVSEYNPQQGEAFNDLVAGQTCRECDYELKL